MRIVLDTAADPEPAPDPELAWSRTVAGWSERLSDLDCMVAQRDARHAYAVLSGLTAAGGGMVAAATMSLPERARQGRGTSPTAGRGVAAAGHPGRDPRRRPSLGGHA